MFIAFQPRPPENIFQKKNVRRSLIKTLSYFSKLKSRPMVNKNSSIMKEFCSIYLKLWHNICNIDRKWYIHVYVWHSNDYNNILLTVKLYILWTDYNVVLHYLRTYFLIIKISHQKKKNYSLRRLPTIGCRPNSLIVAVNG